VKADSIYNTRTIFGVFVMLIEILVVSDYVNAKKALDTVTLLDKTIHYSITARNF